MLTRMPILVIFLLSQVAACAGNSPHTYKLYPGPARDKAYVAILEFGNAVCQAEVDGLQVNCRDYGTLQIEPGRHHVEFDAVFGVSYLINPEMQDDITASGEYVFEAGHHYLLQADRTLGHGYVMYAWIEDAATGVTIPLEVQP